MEENDNLVAEGSNIRNAGRQDGDDDYGDFEGFEDGDVPILPAAAAGPSPWATFPDLLPVQTSPANPPGEDHNQVTSHPALQLMPRTAAEALEPGTWLAGAVGGSQSGSGSIQHISNMASGVGIYSQVAPRTNNPPDISLVSGNSSRRGTSTPKLYNGLWSGSRDSRLQSSEDEESNGRVSRERERLRLEHFQNQIDGLTTQRASLEQQLLQVNRENASLSQELQNVVAQRTELQHRLAESQERQSCEQAVNSDVMLVLNQIQASLTLVCENQSQEKQNLLRLEGEFRLLAEKVTDLEKRNLISQKPAEGSFPSILTDQISVEIKQLVEQSLTENRELLESERRHQHGLVTRTMQSALKQLAEAISSIQIEDSTQEKS